MQATDVTNPDYYHRVVDCQWACPAHTDVPEYIRLIALGRYTDSYMLNRASNVFPGILGRTCDRPCEPACRRRRIDAKPVAICRLKRVAADLKDDIKARLPRIPTRKNGKKVALIGAGSASLTVANDLMPLGYQCHIFEKFSAAGGLMRTNIPAFRLPVEVLQEELDMIIDMGVVMHYDHEITSLQSFLADHDFDAVFIGSGAPKGKDLAIAGRNEASANIHIGIEWLESVAFGHTTSIGSNVVIIGAGNTAMDCCRTAKRIGGKNVYVMARKPRHLLKASEWELDDAEEENVELLLNHAPQAFLLNDGKLCGTAWEKVAWDEDAQGKLVARKLGTAEIPCDDVILAIGQENAFPWIERDIGIDFDKWDMPVVDRQTFQSTRAEVFFGGDAAFGPENIITAVAHGHAAAISIHQYCHSKPVNQRPPQGANLYAMKMGMHQWRYSNDYSTQPRQQMVHVELAQRLKKLATEVELGFSAEQTSKELERCLNCDIQTHFSADLCIECDACIDICPLHCLTITSNADEDDLRGKLTAPADNREQSLYVSTELPQTKRVMVKDENLCIHCGLCAERCPTAAWDMQKFELVIPYADKGGCGGERPATKLVD